MDGNSLLAALPSLSGVHWLLVGVLIPGFVSLWSLIRAARHLRSRRYGRSLTRGLGGIVLAGLTALIGSLGLNALTYSRLTAETPVATIRFASIGPQHYLATLTQPDGTRRRVQLKGDDWQLSARVIKWKGIGTLLGLPPMYRLDRLSGRYENLHQAQSLAPSIVGLSHNPGLALTTLADASPWLPLIDARYGSATYLPMVNDGLYRVSISATGLLARPGNAAARAAVQRWQ